MKVALAPRLEKFVAGKIKSGEFLDASDVIRESLRRWKEHEESVVLIPERLEQAIEEGIDSADLPGGPEFWRDLRSELHKDHKNGSRSK